MQENAGLMHSETGGPLKKLIENLSGKNGEYWLQKLKSMLRGEPPPVPPQEILNEMRGFQTRKSAKQAVEKIRDYLITIPVVQYAHICEDGDPSLINIGVYARLDYFLQGEIQQDSDTAYFYLEANGIVTCGGVDEDDADLIYDKWEERFDKEPNLKDFCVALLDLGKMYEEAVLSIEYK